MFRSLMFRIVLNLIIFFIVITLFISHPGFILSTIGMIILCTWIGNNILDRVNRFFRG